MKMLYGKLCRNLSKNLCTSKLSSPIQTLLIQKHERKSRNACGQAAHALGRGQAAPTTLTSSPERFGANSCTRMPGGHFHELLSRTDEQPCNQMETEGRSTSPSRRSTWPSRRRSRSTRSNIEKIEKEYVAVEKEIQKLLHDLRRRPRTATQAASLSQAPRIPCRPCGSALSKTRSRKTRSPRRKRLRRSGKRTCGMTGDAASSCCALSPANCRAAS